MWEGKESIDKLRKVKNSLESIKSDETRLELDRMVRLQIQVGIYGLMVVLVLVVVLAIMLISGISLDAASNQPPK